MEKYENYELSEEDEEFLTNELILQLRNDYELKEVIKIRSKMKFKVELI